MYTYTYSYRLIVTGEVLSQSQKQPLLDNDQIRADFGQMIIAIRRILSQSPDWEDNLKTCKELCIYLKASDNANIPLFSTAKISEINNCRDFKQLFEIVNQHLSWDEYSILTIIINECNSDEAEEEFKKYQRKMAVSKALEIISSAESDPPQGFQRFCVIIDKPYKKLTIEKYEEIKTFIFYNLDVNRYVTNKYIRVLFESLHLEWHVTMQAIPHMIKMARERQNFFINDFVFMQIGKEVIINIPTEEMLVSLHIRMYIRTYVRMYLMYNMIIYSSASLIL